MKKTPLYIVVIVVLLVANGWLLFSSSSKVTKEKRSYFDATALELVNAFKFSNKNDTTEITRTADGWVVNDAYPADDRFMGTLISVLERLEEGRRIESWQGDVEGEVKIEIDGKPGYQFQVATNATKTKSYFVTDDGATEVAVPGYRDNVADIFLLHADQWRSRLVVDANWRSIQKLTVVQADTEAMTITFDDKFFLVNGETPQDSSAVVDYLNQFEYFEANEMISSGRFPELDSVRITAPVASIEIDDFKQEEAITIQIFPSVAGQPYHLVVEGDRMMVIDARRVATLLPSASDFMQ